MSNATFRNVDNVTFHGVASPRAAEPGAHDFWAFEESNGSSVSSGIHGSSEGMHDSHEGMRDRKPADVDPPRHGVRRWASYVAFFTMVFASMAAAATVAGGDLPLLMVSL